MGFKEEYPNIWRGLQWLALALCFGVANALYANSRYNEGVEQGRAQQICEIGGMMQLPDLPDACREWLKRTPTTQEGQ